jgi:plastocyanin
MMTVDVYVDGSLHETVTPDSEGRWESTVSGLAPGSHSIYAVAHYNSLTSDPSATVEVIVDPTLFWSPLSLRFVDQHGSVLIPKDERGRLDETGWRIFLRPGRTYTVSVFVCCDDPNATVTLEVPGVGVITLTDPDGDRTFGGSFTTPNPMPAGNLRLCVVCDLVERCSDGRVLIDPEGHVYDVTQGLESGKLAEAIVTCQEQTGGETGFNLWPAGDFGQVNPQTTGADGYYSFFTPPGTYRVSAGREGYQDYTSPDLYVVAEPVEHDVPLTPLITETADYTVTIGPFGFEPSLLEIKAGDVVEWLNVDAKVHTTRFVTDALTGSSRALTNDDGWDSGLLGSGGSYKYRFMTSGSYTYQDPGNPIIYTAQIIVSDDLKYIYLPVVIKE